MRNLRFLFPLLALAMVLPFAGFAVAQDTDFSNGPQYLMNNGSPIFAQPITTPEIAIETPTQQPGDYAASASGPTAQSEPSSAPAPNSISTPDYYSFYYGNPYGTPNAGAFASTAQPEVQPETGQPSESFFNGGVTRIVDLQELRQQGVGISLADAAARWKNRKPNAARTYTNQDIDRLKQGS